MATSDSKDKKISEVPHLEDVTGVEKIPVSAQGGEPRYVEVKQIVEKAVEEVTEESNNLERPLIHPNGVKGLSFNTINPPKEAVLLQTGYNDINAGNIWLWWLDWRASNYGIFHDIASGKLVFTGSNKGVFSIDLVNGWVGINTSTPSQALQVIGNVQINGNVSAQNITEIEEKLDTLQQKTAIVTPDTESLVAEAGKLYRFDSEVNTLAVTLPDMDGSEYAADIMFHFTTGSLPHVTIDNQDDQIIKFAENVKIEPDSSYEMSILWDGKMWCVALLNIKSE